MVNFAPRDEKRRLTIKPLVKAIAILSKNNTLVIPSKKPP
jgi:hypothetical protein